MPGKMNELFIILHSEYSKPLGLFQIDYYRLNDLLNTRYTRLFAPLPISKLSTTPITEADNKCCVNYIVELRLAGKSAIATECSATKYIFPLIQVTSGMQYLHRFGESWIPVV